MELRELQLYQINILNEFVRVCEENNLKYYLAWGTLLGAVRHKGFIPWDDDIDVYMPYEDYKKLKEACAKSLDEKYYYANKSADSKFYSAWTTIGVKNSTSIDLSLAKIHMPWGICMDIFPLFPCPENIKILKKCKRYNRMRITCAGKYFYKYSADKQQGVKKYLYLLMGMIPEGIGKSMFEYYERKLGECKNDSEYYIDYEINDSYKNLKKSWFKEEELIFENRKYKVPVGYKEYLTMTYGDYMKEPEVKTKHSDNPNVLTRFDEPYTKYYE